MSDIVAIEGKSTDTTPRQGMNFTPLLRTAKRKALLIVAIASLVTSVYIYKDNQKNPALKYTGGFQLLVEPLTLEAKSSEPSTLINSQGIPNDRLATVDYPTMLRILKSPDILSQITERVKKTYKNFTVDRLAQNLIVERVADSKNALDASKILAVSYTEQDPDLVELVLETTAQKYLEYSLNSRKQGINKGIEFIERQLPELDQEVTQDLNEIQKIQEQYRLFQADAKGESLLGKLSELESQQLETQKEIQEQTQVIKSLESQLGITANEAVTIAALRENPSYQKLIEQFKDRERELALASTKFKSNSPQVTNLLEEKQKISDLLDIETKKTIVDGEISDQVNKFLVLDNKDSILLTLVEKLVEATNERDKLQAREGVLSKNIALYDNQAQNFPEVSRQYKQLQQELSIANRTREQLLVQKDKLHIQASQTETPWTVVSQPEIMRDNAGNPKPLPTDADNGALKGLMGGLFLGLATAFLLEKIRNVFYSTDDISDAFKSSIILAQIPLEPRGKIVKNPQTIKNIINKGKRAQNNDRSSFIDSIDGVYTNVEFKTAFEDLYANIYFRYRQDSIKTIAVCSASEGDGKSTIALNLARAIAADGKRVLLVDASLFNSQLAEMLVSANQVEDNLFTLIAPQKMLKNSINREKLMNEFRNNYDYVIYDTPSLLDSTTAGFLAVNTDGVLLVAAINKTKKSLFTKAYKQIEHFKIPLLGIVTNHAGSVKLETNPLVNLEQIKLLEPSSARKSSDAQINS
ncbi:lipopolysaccharide biosynthesis protein [Chondrocystis sp. NIES-4102]|nr:lipopolysaccharide biosynthesis protein [Chondrocystis sp. NIES-4102]